MGLLTRSEFREMEMFVGMGVIDLFPINNICGLKWRLSILNRIGRLISEGRFVSFKSFCVLEGTSGTAQGIRILFLRGR